MRHLEPVRGEPALGQAQGERLFGRVPPAMTAPVGRVEGIYLAPAAGGPPRPAARVRAVAGRGLEGDRYFFPEGGTWAQSPGSQLTFIEAEALDALAEMVGVDLRAGEHRRNVVTRGIELNDLVGRHFLVAAVECVGVGLCEPCIHVEQLAGRTGVVKGLLHRGGLRADILTGGEIALGDSVREVPAT